MLAMLSSICALVSSWRVSSRPEGSPTLVVPAPISAIGLWPVFCHQRSSMICSRWPTWSEAAVRRWSSEQGIALQTIDLVGFHGQTITHRPEKRFTWQIGDGAELARALGVRVVNDLRGADVAAGGQGAPLVPVYHAALVRDLPRPLAVLNIGGVANVTWIGADGTLLAFDTGPGNGPIDDWCARRAGRRFDEDGALAAAGKVDRAPLERFSQHRFFAKVPPKSLDRGDFREA